MKIIKYILLLTALLFSVNLAYTKSHPEITNDSAAGLKENLAGKVIEINKKEFLNKIFNYEKNQDVWVYEDSVPCIIFFYANWCRPCKITDPILKELAIEFKGKIIIYKINLDKERSLASILRVRSVPTYIFIPAKGNPKYSMGAMRRESFVKIIKEFLLK